MVPHDQMKFSEIQDIMLQQEHFTWKLSDAVFHERANHCRKGDDIEGSYGIATALFASFYQKQLRKMEKKQLLITYNEVK